MFVVKTLPEFADWIEGIKDRPTRFRLLRRLERVQRGLLGDVASVGDGVFEMREFFGPGWRMYYTRRNEVIVVMLGDGDKSTQESDIARAKALALESKDF